MRALFALPDIALQEPAQAEIVDVEVHIPLLCTSPEDDCLNRLKQDKQVKTK